MTVITHKKLIEVALPLEAINKASAREKSIRHGHPSTLHSWWARRPLAAARAVILAQMVDDPSAHVDVLRGDPKLLKKGEAALKPRLKLWEEAKALAEKAKGTTLSVPFQSRSRVRLAKVLDAEGKPLTVREALALINQTLDEALAEQEGDFDADSRWALTWFEQMGFAEGVYGVAEQLSKSKNTAVAGMVQAGNVASRGGRVRLLKPEELLADWDPSIDPRLTAWEIVHQLIRALESGGEPAAALLVAKLGAKAEVARELCYRLYTLCERKKRAPEALSYNGLVLSWPEIMRLAQDQGKTSPDPAQAQLL